jgi:hypothetical protein
MSTSQSRTKDKVVSAAGHTRRCAESPWARFPGTPVPAWRKPVDGVARRRSLVNVPQMLAAIPALALLLSLPNSPASGPGTPATAVAAQPVVPNVVTFHLGDGRERTSGLTLSFGLPGMIAYECRQIVHREERRDGELRIIFLGVATVKNERSCRLVKEPAPIVERITLLSAPGEYRIVFVNGGRTDAYALRVARETVELVAEGRPQFTACDEKGKLSRVGARWMWVDFSFITDESRRKMTARRDEVLAALVALGARPFTPPPGRYLLDGFVREFPGRRPAHGSDETYFFEWDGDGLALQKLADRYRKYAVVTARRPVMQMWFSTRDNVISTYGAGVNTFAE